MTNAEKNAIIERQRQGLSYRRIAEETGLPAERVKSFLRRHKDEGKTDICPACGGPVRQIDHKKQKRFCSEACRRKWWAEHPEARAPRKVYPQNCSFCGQSFISLRAGRRFCSRACFAQSRRKAVQG